MMSFGCENFYVRKIAILKLFDGLSEWICIMDVR